MKTAREIYPDQADAEWFSTGDYQSIINSFGEVLIQVDDNDYQGDSRVILKSERKYGYLNFGWGSCSGCDSLQACGSLEEADELIERLYNDIMWFDTLEDLQKYFKEKDWELDYTWHSEEQKDFIIKVLSYKE